MKGLSIPRLESAKVIEALTWYDTLGTPHYVGGCNCIVCESYRDGTLDWSKAPTRNHTKP